MLTEWAVQVLVKYLYFTLPDCRTVPVILGRFLVENDLVSPLEDDLVSVSQTYQVIHV